MHREEQRSHQGRFKLDHLYFTRERKFALSACEDTTEGALRGGVGTQVCPRGNLCHRGMEKRVRGARERGQQELVKADEGRGIGAEWGEERGETRI